MFAAVASPSVFRVYGQTDLYTRDTGISVYASCCYVVLLFAMKIDKDNTYLSVVSIPKWNC